MQERNRKNGDRGIRTKKGTERIMNIDREVIQGTERKVEAALNWKVRKCRVGGGIGVRGERAG